MSHSRFFILCLALLVCALIGCRAQPLPVETQVVETQLEEVVDTSPEDQLLEVFPLPKAADAEFHGLYGGQTLEQQMKSADYIVLGTIKEIAHTAWNQDSGEYWAFKDGGPAAMPYYTLTIAPEEVWVGEKQESYEMTIIGVSPLDDQSSDMDAQSFEVGARLLFFAKKGAIAWYHGTREATGDVGTKATLLFLTDPSIGHLVEGKDGIFSSPGAGFDTGKVYSFSLEEGYTMIAKHRPTEIQPSLVVDP